MIERVRVAESQTAISKIGFGCAPIYAGSEMRTSAHLIEAALSAGVKHFDTAPVYGGGESEDVLGQVLNGVDGVTVTTKVGIERPNSPAAQQRAATVAYRRFVRPLLSHMPGVKSQLVKLRAGMRDNAPAPVVPRRKLHRAFIRSELAESLKRLKRDYVDLYLVHDPDQFDLDDEALETFIALKREGVIGAFGLAYSRSVSETPDFGTVIQSQYRNEEPSQAANNKTRIFHGVLRHGWRNDSRSKVDGYVANALKDPNVCIIFWASSARHIRQVTAAFT